MWLTLMVLSLAASVTAPAPGDPFALARAVEQSSEVDWAALGWRPELTPCRVQQERVPCSVEIIVVAEPEQAIVLIYTEETRQEVYLRYVRDQGGQWRFSGGHQALVFAYPRRHEVSKSKGGHFLVVAQQGMRGTGTSSELEEWFDLEAREFRPAFSCQVRGRQFELGRGRLGREYTASVLPIQGEIVVLLHLNVYRIQGAVREDAGRIEAEASYRRGAAGRYEFGGAKFSNGSRRLPRAEWDALMDVDEGADDAMLRRLMTAR